MTRKVTPLATRFWGKVHVTPNCWLWSASVTGSGYGQIGLGRKLDGRGDSHRIAWLLCNGPIPDGQQVLHKCDNKRCVNPDHLYLGTNAQNMQDALQRGQKPRGSKCSFAKLTDNQVAEIRATTGISHQKLSENYGVSRVTITRVKNEVSYRNN